MKRTLFHNYLCINSLPMGNFEQFLTDVSFSLFTVTPAVPITPACICHVYSQLVFNFNVHFNCYTAWSQVCHLSIYICIYTKSEEVGLTDSKNSVQDFQLTWSGSNNVKDGHTDRQTKCNVKGQSCNRQIECCTITGNVFGNQHGNAAAYSLWKYVRVQN